MADAYAYITFALEKIEQILIDNRSGAMDHLLKNHLEMMKALLIDQASRKSKGWQKHMREVINETEDIIDSYFLSQSMANTYRLRRWRNRIHLANEIKKIREQHMATKVWEDLHILLSATRVQSEHPNEAESYVKHLRMRKDGDQKLVGFEDCIKELMEDIHENSDKLEVITLIGMAGIGKTAVASKIFNDPSIIKKFPTRIWIDASEYHDVYAKILKEINPVEVSRMDKDDFKLKQQVSQNLKGLSFFMVLDNAWTAQAWKYIKDVLPMNSESKVLITSRENSVGSLSIPPKKLHVLPFLTHEESWKLLQYRVHEEKTGHVWPLNRIDVGEEIARMCEGLPLALVTAANFLRGKLDQDIEIIRRTWTQGSQDYMSRIIGLSYEKLSHSLKECFLYLGVFPEHFEIPVWKLIRLWIAEGFIQEVVGGPILEDIAMEYVQDLIARNLVKVGEVNARGKPKTCRIHSVIHAFCKKEAGDIGFFQEIMMTSTLPIPQASHVSKFHRLCVHSHVMEFFSNKPKGPHTRSFLCFNNDEENIVWPENSSDILQAFDLLRIFEGNSIIFSEYPTKLEKLIHLKYIMLAMDDCILPKKLSKLRNLQTLIIITSSPKVEIKVDISNMVELRHLKTKAAITLANDKKGICNLNLQTLSRISFQSCNYEILKKFPYLKALGICGKLIPPIDQCCLQKLVNLQKLKIYYDSQGMMMREIRLPPNLKMLTLSETKFPWEHMSTLAQLENLEILKLKENAFKGEHWKEDGDGFLSLRFLQIERSDLITWTTSDNAFPKLSVLVLKNCENLLAIPPGLAKTLQTLELKRVTKDVVSSAREIERQTKECLAHLGRWGRFKLVIAPEDL